MTKSANKSHYSTEISCYKLPREETIPSSTCNLRALLTNPVIILKEYECITLVLLTQISTVYKPSNTNISCLYLVYCVYQLPNMELPLLLNI